MVALAVSDAALAHRVLLPCHRLSDAVLWHDFLSELLSAPAAFLSLVLPSLAQQLQCVAVCTNFFGNAEQRELSRTFCLSSLVVVAAVAVDHDALQQIVEVVVGVVAVGVVVQRHASLHYLPWVPYCHRECCSCEMTEFCIINLVPTRTCERFHRH